MNTKAAKILVVGPGEAGKSTLISGCCSDALNLAVGGRTVALDHGTLTREGRKLVLIGVPGQPRFAAVRESLRRGASAAVWVHPAGTTPDEVTASLLADGELAARPYLVVVNLRGGPGSAEFVCPPRLPPPKAVVATDLLLGSPLEGSLIDTLWSLVELD